MKTKSKLVLGLSILSAATLAAGATSTFAWYQSSRSASITHGTALSVQATTQKGWLVTIGVGDTPSYDFDDPTTTVNLSSLTIARPTAAVSTTSPTMKTWLEQANGSYVEDATANTTKVSSFTFKVKNTNPADAANPTIRITVTPGTVDTLRYALFEGSTLKDHSAYYHSADAAHVPLTGTDKATSVAAVENSTYASVAAVTASDVYTVIYWADGANVVENNYQNVGAYLEISIN